MLELRKVADKSKGDRVTLQVAPPEETLEDGRVVIDPSRIEQRLVNPETPGFDHEPWPLKHVELVGDAPDKHNFSDTVVAKYMQDGFLTIKNMRLATTENYERNPVITGDEFVLDLRGGKLRYKILQHPGRYNDGDGEYVTHEYTCERIGGK